eukprot:459190-Prorocentrum_minimum.AAC.2
MCERLICASLRGASRHVASRTPSQQHESRTSRERTTPKCTQTKACDLRTGVTGPPPHSVVCGGDYGRSLRDIRGKGRGRQIGLRL